MEKEPKNKVVVITGGAEGLGYEIAKYFLINEAKVVILLDINEELGIKTSSNFNAAYGKGKTVFIQCDVNKDLDSVFKTILQDYPTVDVLVNSAGIVDEQTPRKVIEINVIATIEWSLKFFEHMRKDKGGKGGTIINLGSLYSFMVDPYMVIYKASKYAVMGFSRSLGHEDNYNKFGVRVLILCPGLTWSAMTRKQMIWDEHVEGFEQVKRDLPFQEADVVGNLALEVFKKANSGTAWTIVSGVLEEFK